MVAAWEDFNQQFRAGLNMVSPRDVQWTPRAATLPPPPSCRHPPAATLPPTPSRLLPRLRHKSIARRPHAWPHSSPHSPPLRPSRRNQVMSGITYWTTDIGGFGSGNTEDPDFRELVVRWFQWG